jgi:hypothetical protein
MTRPYHKIRFDIEREQPVKQWSLAIVVPLRELGVRDLFAAVVCTENLNPRVGVMKAAKD